MAAESKGLNNQGLEHWASHGIQRYRAIARGLTRPLRKHAQVLSTTAGVSCAVIGLRLLGGLQLLEWSVYDQFFRFRPLPPLDQRITIVAIGENDLRQVGRWPVPDQAMAELILRLKAYQPRVIGLDIFRDLPVEPGHSRLQAVFNTTPNLIGIEQIKDQYSLGVMPPVILAQQDQVGFNNLVFDLDGRVRRNLLFWTLAPEQETAEATVKRPSAQATPTTHTSFGLKLALAYLKPEGIEPQTAPNSQYLQLGKAHFERLQSNAGGYINMDNGGYQILAQMSGPAGRFQQVSMSDVLRQKVAPQLLRDRIVLIGSTATSLKDVFSTAYTSEVWGKSGPEQMAGVEIQANFISQILRAATDTQPLMQTWPEWAEWLWIVGWAGVGAQGIWRGRSPIITTGFLLLSGGAVIGLGYWAFLHSWWIPVIPSLMAIGGATAIITVHLVQLEQQLKRSKEFFSTLVNAIPDPVFVKDRNHRWIVVNPAYCKLLGYEAQELLDQTDEAVFPPHEVQLFRAQEQTVFTTGQDQEIEEILTDRSGGVRMLATKRSLHCDPAGNRYLVGVIRDITDRKRSEEELKQTAAELVKSNAELQLSASRLQYLANHDTLTGLPNRKLFYERFEQSLLWARDRNQQVGLMFLDLDGFKHINDTHGHDIGDLLLQAVAQRLTGCLRGSDTVARLAGDEFTVILPAIPNRQKIITVAEKILTQLGRPFLLNQHNVSVTTSIGISLFPTDGQTQDELIKGADTAMYEAKQRGKNQFRFADAIISHS